MHFIDPTPEQATIGLRAMKAVTTAAGPLDATRRALFDAIQKHVLHTDHDFDALEPITPEAVSSAIADPGLRDQLARAICLHVMIPDAPPQQEVELANAFVRALDASPDAMERVRSMYKNRLLALRFDATRNSFMGDSTRRIYADQGALGVLANIGGLLGVHESETLAARYRALSKLPEGSLGRAFHKFYSDRGFPFPGEKGGAPESIVAHDLTHVLINLSTDLPSEACVTSFQAGYRRDGPITGLQFVLLNMEKGVKMTKLAPGAKHMFGAPGMAERIATAFARGTEVSMDLVLEWKYWNDMDRPLTEVRQQLRVVPLA
jgi:hypothetical protein